MTVRVIHGAHRYTGLASDIKPTWIDPASTASGYLPIGSRFIELDTRKEWTFDGAGTWYEAYDARKYYIDTRTGITITTTSSHLWSGGTLTKYGELLRSYIITNADTVNDVTRTMSIVDANSVTVWASTATTDAATSARLLPTSEQVILDGTYTVVWTLSTASQTTGITDYFQLSFDRG